MTALLFFLYKMFIFVTVQIPQHSKDIFKVLNTVVSLQTSSVISYPMPNETVSDYKNPQYTPQYQAVRQF
ncbi:hypothetical protein RO04_08065 [Aggregatibacter actinomycetemcomitans]|uniref:Uncharacterized protein n=1 Tax=Aggregatibacter actinomycetemcomitans TaxID=714 RepID=A0A2G1DN81_AGGAC|nr:hypothetical protein RO04_08065 [Aggregatibacter actinomycetemcomitans]PHO19948.1 hypothetical protein CQR80_09325 [Aggregatibacter actinomycetemcomitans]PHO22336.1 hypothetical protein CQR79_08570 [Aggregatibacter actinomycetemcomitans]